LINYGLASVLFGGAFLAMKCMDMLGVPIPFGIVLEKLQAIQVLAIVQESVLRACGIFALYGLIAVVQLLPSTAIFSLLRLIGDTTFSFMQK
jgi:hypothetical protein